MGSLSQVYECQKVAKLAHKWPCPPPGMAVCTVLFLRALTLSCLGFVMMSVMAGGDQHAVYSHLVAVSSTGFYSLNVLSKREWPGFYSAGCGAITLGIRMFSYYPTAPAEIAVLPWAAAYPYWQAGRHSSSFISPITSSSPAFVVWNLDGFIGHCPSGDHDQPGRAGGGYCSNLWASRAVSLGKQLQLLLDAAARAKVGITCWYPVPHICAANRKT